MKKQVGWNPWVYYHFNYYYYVFDLAEVAQFNL